MYIKEIIHRRFDDFVQICKTHRVKSLYAFGSSVGSDFDRNSSDIDLLIDIESEDPIEKGKNLMLVWDKFESFFNTKVDLLTNTSIKNPILKSNIDNSKVLIYDGENTEVSI
jgi:predicted nucleotidyltransferase